MVRGPRRSIAAEACLTSLEQGIQYSKAVPCYPRGRRQSIEGIYHFIYRFDYLDFSSSVGRVCGFKNDD
jgi:hypothetical protein